MSRWLLGLLALCYLASVSAQECDACAICQCKNATEFGTDGLPAMIWRKTGKLREGFGKDFPACGKHCNKDLICFETNKAREGVPNCMAKGDLCDSDGRIHPGAVEVYCLKGELCNVCPTNPKLSAMYAARGLSTLQAEPEPTQPKSQEPSANTRDVAGSQRVIQPATDTATPAQATNSAGKEPRLTSNNINRIV